MTATIIIGNVMEGSERNVSLKPGVRDWSVRDCFLGSVDVTTRAGVSIKRSEASHPVRLGCGRSP